MTPYFSIHLHFHCLYINRLTPSILRCISHFIGRASGPRLAAPGLQGPRLVRQAQTGPMPFLDTEVPEFQDCRVVYAEIPCCRWEALFRPRREARGRGHLPPKTASSDGEPQHHTLPHHCYGITILAAVTILADAVNDCSNLLSQFLLSPVYHFSISGALNAKHLLIYILYAHIKITGLWLRSPSLLHEMDIPASSSTLTTTRVPQNLRHGVCCTNNLQTRH
jgi:hypothetical protein